MSRTIRRIVCHHTDSAPTTDAATIRGWHVDGNGWSDIGYHWVIRQTADGEWMTEQGRPEHRTGSHAKGSNSDSIGIVVAGRYTDAPLPETAELMLCAIVAAKCMDYGLGAQDVYGHREVMAPGYTVCPGYDMDRIRDRVAGYLRAAR
jgi:N-acetylmuramoyl-L-alanine amidase.